MTICSACGGTGSIWWMRPGNRPTSSLCGECTGAGHFQNAADASQARIALAQSLRPVPRCTIDRMEDGTWRLTHKPSGSMLRCMTRREARAERKRVLEREELAEYLAVAKQRSDAKADVGREWAALGHDPRASRTTPAPLELAKTYRSALDNLNLATDADIARASKPDSFGLLHEGVPIAPCPLVPGKTVRFVDQQPRPTLLARFTAWMRNWA